MKSDLSYSEELLRKLLFAAENGGAIRTAENSRMIDRQMAAGVLECRSLDIREKPISSKRYFINKSYSQSRAKIRDHDRDHDYSDQAYE